MTNAITINNLSKDYGKIHALQKVSLQISAGQITGLVGPNGAGKSTLIKSLVGALQPDQGEISVLNLNPISERWTLRKKLGYMPQEPALYMDLTASENVTFYGLLHRLANPRQQAEKLLAELDLGDRLKSPVHTLSGGMRSRVSLACALVHKPELLILDEPTAGLDPLLKRHLWQRFRELVSQGKTLLISTHLMDEAMLCHYVILLQHGQVVAQDAPHKLVATGFAKLRFRDKSKEWSETVLTEGESMATSLRKYGLNKNIENLEIEAENLEDVMVAKLREQKEEKK
jgi:ABC-2 type transport system ATP-binding protein